MALVRSIILAAALQHGVNPDVLDRMAFCESTYRPLAVSGPNVGLYQLSRYGKLRDFYRLGYDDWTDAAQQSDFVAQQLVEGAGPAWSCFPRWLPLMSN